MGAGGVLRARVEEKEKQKIKGRRRSTRNSHGTGSTGTTRWRAVLVSNVGCRESPRRRVKPTHAELVGRALSPAGRGGKIECRTQAAKERTK